LTVSTLIDPPDVVSDTGRSNHANVTEMYRGYPYSIWRQSPDALVGKFATEFATRRFGSFSPAFTVRQPIALADCERLAEPTSCGAQP